MLSVTFELKFLTTLPVASGVVRGTRSGGGGDRPQ